MKRFNLGFFVGRFQHIHKGHEELINFGLENCNRMCILISSSQRSRTILNPFNIQERKDMILKVYNEQINHGRIIIHPIEDFIDDMEKSSNWKKYIGKSILEGIQSSCSELPDLFIYGNDDLKKRHYFTDEERVNLSEIIVSRNHMQTYSATKLREYLMDDNFEEWSKCVNEKIWNQFEHLRSILLGIN